MIQLAVITVASTPASIVAAGDRAAYCFAEFFTAQIRNPNTRRSYARAVDDFLAWLNDHDVASIAAVSSLHVATYIEHLARTQSAPTVKLRLAAIRSLLDWLTLGGVLPFNPASAVRGPKHAARIGKTAVLDPEDEGRGRIHPAAPAMGASQREGRQAA